MLLHLNYIIIKKFIFQYKVLNFQCFSSQFITFFDNDVYIKHIKKSRFLDSNLFFIIIIYFLFSHLPRQNPQINYNKQNRDIFQIQN